jgi:putative transposase
MKEVREKSHRLPRSAYNGNVIVSFTINTDKRVAYFNDVENIAITAQALAEAFETHLGHVGVYVFMPDHVHLIVSGSSPEKNLLDLVEGFKQKTTFRIRKNRKAFAWQKDFYDHIIREDEDYGAQVRYLLRNPVRKGLCEHWEHWPHKGVLGQTWEQLVVNITTS